MIWRLETAVRWPGPIASAPAPSGHPACFVVRQPWAGSPGQRSFPDNQWSFPDKWLSLNLCSARC